MATAPSLVLNWMNCKKVNLGGELAGRYTAAAVQATYCISPDGAFVLVYVSARMPGGCSCCVCTRAGRAAVTRTRLVCAA
jgi:hypothetical protein